jgi:Arc/MetJ-type ribon-helix-helix transcriptional regulator
MSTTEVPIVPVKFSSPEIEQFVQLQVISGAFPSVDAVLEAAVTRMMHQSDDELTDEDWEDIHRADAEIERGEFVDLQTLKAQMLAKYGPK